MPRPFLNWESVELLDEAHLLDERDYFEDLQRWALGAAGLHGIVRMHEQKDLVVIGSDHINVTLNACQAVLNDGSWVDIGGSSAREFVPTLQSKRADLPDSTPLIYLTPAGQKDAKRVNSDIAALKTCIYRQKGYTLALANAPPELNSLEIGRVTLQGEGYTIDPEHIPPCVRLDSHHRLTGRVKEILQVAQDCLGTLKKGSGSDRRASQGTLISALVPITILADWRMHPLNYVDRAATGLSTISELLYMDKGAWNLKDNLIRADQSIQTALRSISAYSDVDTSTPVTDLGAVLKAIYDALSALLQLFPNGGEMFRPPEERPTKNIPFSDKPW